MATTTLSLNGVMGPAWTFDAKPSASPYADLTVTDTIRWGVSLSDTVKGAVSCSDTLQWGVALSESGDA